MGELIKLLEDNDVKKQIDGIANICGQLKSDSNAENIFNDEDISLLIERLKYINDVILWNSIWSVFLLSPKNDFIIKYCEKALAENKEIPKQDLSHKRFDYLLIYLFKYVPEKRDELLQEFLNSTEMALKFTAAEELANTQLTKALIIMIDIYESAIHTYDHDIVDAIDSWVCYEGNTDILCELERRMNAAENEMLKTKYDYWQQSIKSKSR